MSREANLLNAIEGTLGGGTGNKIFAVAAGVCAAELLAGAG
jgi:hypothetical protein